jgi:hypothetical protein
VLNIKRGFAALCVLLFVNVSTIKSVKAEVVSGWLILKIVGGILAAGTLWVSLGSYTKAEVIDNRQLVLDNLGEEKFPVQRPISDSIKTTADGKLTGKGYLVSVQDTPLTDMVIRGGISQMGVLGKVSGRSVIAIFTDEYSAKRFAMVVDDMTKRQLEIAVSQDAVDLD